MFLRSGCSCAWPQTNIGRLSEYELLNNELRYVKWPTCQQSSSNRILFSHAVSAYTSATAVLLSVYCALRDTSRESGEFCRTSCARIIENGLATVPSIFRHMCLRIDGQGKEHRIRYNTTSSLRSATFWFYLYSNRSVSYWKY